ncbi:MAG: EAL domain-containing protein, partial [Proteobacteria bacterium]|nr:EAL domain-containing protein [Pseudomonadota bacterium]
EYREAEVIVNSIIQLGKSMELNVVAEGVESQACLDRLRVMGCDQAQGYFISRPLPPAVFLKWLRKHLKKMEKRG